MPTVSAIATDSTAYCSSPILSCLRSFDVFDDSIQVWFYEGIAYNVAAPTQSTCCKTCSTPLPGNGVGIHQSDVDAPAKGHTLFRPLKRTRRVLCQRQAESHTGPSRGCPHPGQVPHRTIQRMSTPRPRATPDHQEDVHTQAKSHKFSVC